MNQLQSSRSLQSVTSFDECVMFPKMFLVNIDAWQWRHKVCVGLCERLEKKKKQNHLLHIAGVCTRKGSGDHIVCERERGRCRALTVIGNNGILELIESRRSSSPAAVLAPSHAVSWATGPRACARSAGEGAGFYFSEPVEAARGCWKD